MSDWDFLVGGFSVSGRPIPLRMTLEERRAYEEAVARLAWETGFWDEALEQVFGEGHRVPPETQ